MKTYPQGSLVWPREPFIAKVERSTIRAFPGQSFWVTNTEQDQERTGIAMIARSGSKGGWAFRLEDANRFFHQPE